jgi:putative chitinase
MTLDELCKATGAHSSDAAKLLPYLDDTFTEFEINTAPRQAAFLAQIGHESGGLHWLREIWGPTPTQEKYEGRTDLGNTEAGDGSRYRGRGYIQLTGRANYDRAGTSLALDFVNQPELLETPPAAIRTAAWFWKEHGLNELADDAKFETITRKINGGLNGYSQRCALWEDAKAVLA